MLKWFLKLPIYPMVHGVNIEWIYKSISLDSFSQILHFLPHRTKSPSLGPTSQKTSPPFPPLLPPSEPQKIPISLLPSLPSNKSPKNKSSTPSPWNNLIEYSILAYKNIYFYIFLSEYGYFEQLSYKLLDLSNNCDSNSIHILLQI